MPPQNARRGRMIGTQLATPWVSSQRVSGPHSTAAQADVRAAAPASVTAPTGGGDVGAGAGRPEQAAARTNTTDTRRARDNIARIVANTPYASADSIAATSPWRVMRSSSRRRPCASQRACSASMRSSADRARSTPSARGRSSAPIASRVERSS